VKRSEIDAWIKGKCPGLAAPKGTATATWEKAADGQVIVTATVYSLVDKFFSTKSVRLAANEWKADRLGPALKSKFNGRQPRGHSPAARSWRATRAGHLHG